MVNGRSSLWRLRTTIRAQNRWAERPASGAPVRRSETAGLNGQRSATRHHPLQ